MWPHHEKPAPRDRNPHPIVITIMGRPEAERYTPAQSPAAMISIRDSCDVVRPANFTRSRYAMVCRSYFDDCFEDEHDLTAITWQQAEEIARFIVKCKEAGIKELVVHCEAGMSRSVGVAAAAADFFDLDDAFCHEGDRRPNKTVQNRVRRQIERVR